MQTKYRHAYARMCTCSSYNYTVKTDRCISLETLMNRALQRKYCSIGRKSLHGIDPMHACMISVNVTYGQKEKVHYDLAADHSAMAESHRESDDS